MPTSSDGTASSAHLLEDRMGRPQRHRLLQGYPALPLMRPAAPGTWPGRARLADGALQDVSRALGLRIPARRDEVADEPPWMALDASRPLIIGVIPHTQCVPRVHGCGFCTFPHDAPDKRERDVVIESVCEEIGRVAALNDDALRGREVRAVYFGGGTANLASAGDVRHIFGALAEHVDLSQAEVTLEGVPSLFRTRLSAHLRGLARVEARHKRISMGIQTFDPAAIQRMGREAFGDHALVRKVVRRAHGLELTTSGDLLLNLPGQTAAQMLDDVDRAIEAGLDQICLYNLVLYAGLGTLWSEDPEVLAAMRTNAEALDGWLQTRERLLAAGFVQTTLTNFEKAEVHASERRFVYEEASFAPERHDALGFGPLAISTFLDFEGGRGVKLMRRKRIHAVPWSGEDLYFPYDAADLRLLYLTRSLARTRLERATYHRLFGADVLDEFGEIFASSTEAGLTNIQADRIELTPEGMFFSDALVGLLAASRAEALHAEAAGVRTRDLHAATVDRSAQFYRGMG